MQCLTWAFSKPHGSQQEPFSSTALWSRSWPQQLPPPRQAPLGAAGGAGLCWQSTSPCSAMGSSAKGASEGLRQQRLGTAASGKAGGCHLSSQKQHCRLSFLSPPVQSPGFFSAGLPWHTSLELGATKSSVAPWSLLFSPCAVMARTKPGHATLPRAPRCAQGTRAGVPRKLHQEPAAGSKVQPLSHQRPGKSIS